MQFFAERDDRTERFLARFSVKVQLVARVGYDQLVPNWDFVNLGRPQARVEEAILQYAAMAEAGSLAPPPILRSIPPLFDVLDGVQRLGSGRLLDLICFPAFVIETNDDSEAKAIRILANPALTGVSPVDPKWARDQAIQHLIIEGGKSDEEVAHRGGWKVKDIERRRKFLQFQFAVGCQAEGPKQMSQGVAENIMERLQPGDFEKASKPIAEFCGVLTKGRFSNGDSKPIIDKFFDGIKRGGRKDLHAQLSEKLQTCLADEEVRTRLEGRRPSPRSAESKLLGPMKAVKTIAEDLVQERCRIPYLEEAFLIWGQVDKSLKKLQELGKVKAAH